MKRLLATMAMAATSALAQPAGYIKDFDGQWNVPNWPGVLDWNTLAPYNIGNWTIPHFISHTPYGGDFGDAKFADGQSALNPFWSGWGHLFIRAWKSNGQWYSGLISSVDTYGNGFAAIGGYWKAQIQVPPGAGTWPAFWLLDWNSVIRHGRTVNDVEIDIFEGYGYNPYADNQLVHVWTPSGQDVYGKPFNVYSLPDGMTQLHTYACWIQPDLIHFYVDNIETWNTPTPQECLTHPMYVMIDLALGAGYPIQLPETGVNMVVNYLVHYRHP